MSARRTLVTWLRRLGPWLVAVAIIVVLSRRYDPAEVLAQMRAGDWRATLAYPMVLPFLYLPLHGLWDTLILRGVLGGQAPQVVAPRYAEVLRGRAGTAVLMLLGYVFGHGGFGVWLARKTGAKARAVSGAVVYTMVSDLGALGLVATVATSFGNADVAPGVRVVAASVVAVPLALALVGPSALASTRAPFLAPWRALGRGLALLQICGRAVDIGLAVLLTWQAARAFGLAIPLSSFATYMPVVLLVTSLPFNVGGMGAAQAAWLVFLPWASGEKILAFQIVWQVFFAVGIVVRGIPFVRRVMREISAPSPE